MGDTITFGEIPAAPGLLVPGSYLEIRPDYARIGILPYPARTLIVAQKTITGTATANALYQNITRAEDAVALGGPGSHLAGMVAAYLAVNDTIPLDVIALGDAGGSVKAIWELTLTASSNKAGTIAVQIAGRRIFVGATATDTATTLGSKLRDAINADTALPVTATAALGVVTVTARNGGTAGNEITFVVNPLPGDQLPQGVTLAVAQTTTGATDPAVATAITTITDMLYTDVALGVNNLANTSLWAAEADRRWNAMVDLPMRVHFAVTGTLSERITKAGELNNRFTYIAGLKAPGSPPWIIAATVAGLAAQKLTDDPARQLLDLGMGDCRGPVRADLDDQSERQLLLAGGITSFRSNTQGLLSLERLVSSYRTNGNGALDYAWLDVMTQAVAARIRYDWKTYFRSIYPSNKLAPDGSLAATADRTVCTPRRAHGTWTARMMVYAQAGWVVDEVAMARQATFVINPADRNRLDYRIAYNRIGNLMVDAGQLLFQA